MEKTPVQIRNEKLADKVVRNLNRRRFAAYHAHSRAEALQIALSLIPAGSTVSWGGSATIREIGLTDAIHAGDYRALDRDAAPAEQRMDVMRQALLSDVYLTSANAISEDGQLVNIDGNGNRVAALTFGPRRVIVVAGINKVAQTVEDAVQRARTVAAPINAQRFGGKTGCAVTGACENCTSEDCICCHFVVTRLCRPAGRIHVILLDEALGY